MPTNNIEQWLYFLSIPFSAYSAAETIAPHLGQSTINSFAKYPKQSQGFDAEGNENLIAKDPPEWYVAQLLVFDLVSEGIPSRQALENALNANPALANILWIRTKNPHHPDTPEIERTKVVATNWNAFTVGGDVSWDLVIDAMGGNP